MHIRGETPPRGNVTVAGNGYFSLCRDIAVLSQGLRYKGRDLVPLSHTQGQGWHVWSVSLTKPPTKGVSPSADRARFPHRYACLSVSHPPSGFGSVSMQRPQLGRARGHAVLPARV